MNKMSLRLFYRILLEEEITESNRGKNKKAFKPLFVLYEQDL